MTLFEKLFSTGSNRFHGSTESRDKRCNKLNPQQVRLLLFKECESHGRKVLFDSATIERKKAFKDDKPSKQTKEPYIVEVTNGFTYIYTGPAGDTATLGEMIFGAVAVHHRGLALKIHIMDQPRRLMWSKVFCVPALRRPSRKCSATSGGDRCEVVGTRPLTVPRNDDMAFSLSFGRGDSGFYGEQSVHSSVSSTCELYNLYDADGPRDDFYSFTSPPGRRVSAGSAGSWHRRTHRTLSTKWEFGPSPPAAHLLRVPTPGSDSQMYSNSSASGTSDSLSSGGSTSYKNKLGLALVITALDDTQREVMGRCLEHSPQLQAVVCRLRGAALVAGAGPQFVHTLYTAAKDAALWLSDLLFGARTPAVWPMLASSDRDASHRTADRLVRDLCALLAAADTKHTNFFMSTLLTHLLTYHLGWVTTVSPYDTVAPQSTSGEGAPYNALWAQLGDLCGSIGHPPKTARTIIHGTNTQLMKRLLSVLTYFIRCGDVTRNKYKFSEQVLETKCSKLVSAVKNSGLKRSTTQKMIVESDTEVSNSSETLTGRETGAGVSDLVEGTLLDYGTSRPMTSCIKKCTSQLIITNNDSSTDSDDEQEKKVVFVLGDNERLVGLKNKSSDGKRVKKSSNVHHEPIDLEQVYRQDELSKESAPKCCSQTSQHSKPIKHSGFKFEFDKYPQIVINYMKSKNLEILDRHLIGKPGNLKLESYQFDPAFVPPIQEDRFEPCHRCEQDAMLQTPTNASEFEYMNDIPRISEPQFARETLVSSKNVEPKKFIRRQVDNAVVVNVGGVGGRVEVGEEAGGLVERGVEVVEQCAPEVCGYDVTLLGGVTDHYVPDLILQGVSGEAGQWEGALRRDLRLTTALSRTQDCPVQAVAVIGNIDNWEVRVESGEGASVGGMSALVGGVLDALPGLVRARVPPHTCLSFVESKLRELCVLSKTLADLLMSRDFCNMETLTSCLNVDVNDVPLLMAVATTHTPQVAVRYGISYR